MKGKDGSTVRSASIMRAYTWPAVMPPPAPRPERRSRSGSVTTRYAPGTVLLPMPDGRTLVVLPGGKTRVM